MPRMRTDCERARSRGPGAADGGTNTSLHDPELADPRADPRRIDREHVEARRHVEVVLGAQVPCDESAVRSVVVQRLHEIAAHRVNADRAARRQAAELDAPLAASPDVEGGWLERCR